MTQIEPQSREVTLESLSARLDVMGQQLDWLCEQQAWLCQNMSGMFSFVTQMGQNGGGIRGMLKSMKDMPAVTPQQAALKQQLLEEGEAIERHQS